jgi:DNA gyrase subunit A
MKNKDAHLFNKNVEVLNIGDACTEYMKIFGANNNLMRHIPSISDGVKPGERRILYTLYNDMKSEPTKKKLKVASIAGNVLKYHPHGDASVMASIVTMGQPWSNNLPLIDGEGNYGSPMGDPAAHGRYIEGRLSMYAWKCFFEQFSPNLVDMKMNYGGDVEEPEYLPAVYPNVLANTTFGIGYGASCGLPTYNFSEVIKLTLDLMDNPLKKNITLIPDSPTGSYIVDEGQFEELSKTGRGKFKMRGQIDIDEENNSLIIRSIPMQTSSDDIKRDILKLVDDGKIQGLHKISDDCRIDDKTLKAIIDITFIFKKEVDPYIIREIIYSKTDMEKTFPVNFKLIDDYQDFDYNIRSLILHWIEFRRETLRRKYNYKLVEAKERQHVLETLLMIIDGKNAEKSLKVIRGAESTKEIREYLMDTFKITSLQADRVSKLTFSAVSAESIRRYKKEQIDVIEKVEKYNSIVRSDKKIDKIIRKELEEGMKLFGEPRRSQVITVNGSPKIRNTDHVVVITMSGFVKKLPINTESVGFINQGDYPVEISRINNTEDLMIFDETGKISKLQIHQLQNSDLNTEGEKLSKYCNINGHITSIVAKPNMDSLKLVQSPVYFIMVTKNGIVKKSSANSYVNLKNELLAMMVKEGDELRSVKIMVGDKDILIYTNNGTGVRFSGKDVKETNRMSIGVKALDMGADDEVVGMDIINEKDNSIFVLTSRGTGKTSTLDNFNTMDRAAKPLRITTLDNNEEIVLIKTVKGKEQFKVYLNTGVDTINIKDVPELPRLSKGRKLISVPKGSRIVDIKEVK